MIAESRLISLALTAILWPLSQGHILGPPPSSALLHQRSRHTRSGGSSSTAVSIQAYFKASTSDFNFWSAEWSACKTQLMRISLLGEVAPPTEGDTFKGYKTPASDAIAHMQAFLKTANSTVKIEMLQSSIDYSQSRVKALHDQEQLSLNRFGEEKARHQGRQQVLEAQLRNHSLVQELFDSESKAEGKQFGKWEKSRQLQQAQLNAGLQIQQKAQSSTRSLLNACQHPQESSLFQQAHDSTSKFVYWAWGEVKKEDDRLENGLSVV